MKEKLKSLRNESAEDSNPIDSRILSPGANKMNKSLNYRNGVEIMTAKEMRRRNKQYKMIKSKIMKPLKLKPLTFEAHARKLKKMQRKMSKDNFSEDDGYINDVISLSLPILKETSHESPGASESDEDGISTKTDDCIAVPRRQRREALIVHSLGSM